jgi:predicted nucleotidyltransferase
MIDLKIFPQRRDGAIVFEECLDRGLIEPDGSGFKITQAGEAIADSKLRPRTALAAAQRVFDDFLDRVERVNADPDSVLQVEQVWLFGSLMREEPTVGDIDAALVAKRRPEFDDHAARRAYVARVIAARVEHPRTWRLEYLGEYWLLERALFGRRRHHLLAGVMTNVDDLRQIDAPCRLVFDRSRGGRVKTAVLDRHPGSTGRSDELSPPLKRPDLTPVALRPMDGRWIAGFSGCGEVSPYRIFRGWSDEAHALFARHPSGLWVGRGVDDGFRLAWRPNSLQNRALDGRNAIAIVNATGNGGASVVLCREIALAPAGCRLCARLEDGKRRRARLDNHAIPDIASAAALIVAVDAERILRRLEEAKSDLPVVVSVEGDDRVDVVAALKDEVVNRLVDRAVRIEPLNWRGQAVSIVRSEGPQSAAVCD